MSCWQNFFHNQKERQWKCADETAEDKIERDEKDRSDNMQKTFQDETARRTDSLYQMRRNMIVAVSSLLIHMFKLEDFKYQYD